MSLTESSTQQQPGYLPRNAVDHINPFFFHQHHKHTHSHSHQHHSQSPTQPSYPDTHATTTSSLQNPVPRRLSVHVDPKPTPPSSSSKVTSSTSLAVNSYSTPPATPPLLDGVSAQKKRTTATALTTSSLVDINPIAWCTARARIPTPDGSEYFLHIYENAMDKKEHMAFVFGDAIRSRSLDKVHWNESELDRVKRGAYTGRLRNIVATGDGESTVEGSSLTSTGEYTISGSSSVPLTSSSASSTTTLTAHVPLARIHSECFTGEIGHSARCDCGEQLDEAIRLMKAEGSGVVVYLRQEGRGIGLGEKLKAYNLQDLGYDTVMANLLLNHGADERTYEVAQAILEDLGLSQVRLLTNNPDKIEQIERDSQIKVVERVPMIPKSWEAIAQGRADELEVKEGAVENKIVRGKELDKYLQVKVERMRHLIPIPSAMAVYSPM
ncbi:GTP cyclohydrolase II [Podila humilis]|nr:GTP cyclohydrolase II [Podila humilis]